jgi:hypothetical protein
MQNGVHKRNKYIRKLEIIDIGITIKILFSVHIVLFRVLLPEIQLSRPSTKYMQATVMKINETNEARKES